MECWSDDGVCEREGHSGVGGSSQRVGRVDTNFVQTLSAISKAQLLPSRLLPGSSPFE